MKVAVVGGGAAGFFSAIHAKQNHPNAQVILFEKSNKVLAKVRVSGGGRCNVTNGTTSISELSKGYPRGEKKLKKAFHEFNTAHTRQWFEERGVALKTEADNRVFPVSNSSQTIIDCLLKEVDRQGVEVSMSQSVTNLLPTKDGIALEINDKTEQFDKVIVASGGSPKLSGLQWLADLGHKIVTPVPSLFTFNMPKDPVTSLMGVVAERAKVSIQGVKHKSEGPLLVTHWGMSGPAVLKLSAFAARDLFDRDYTFTLQVNWIGESNFDIVLGEMNDLIKKHPAKMLQNVKAFELPERLWLFLLAKAEIPKDKIWSELSKKALHKLINTLSNDEYPVKGKTTFKEEFVTCGGVSLESVDMQTMQSRLVPHLYFAGEVLDIDGITGGYNFQAAWTTGYLAGKLG